MSRIILYLTLTIGNIFVSYEKSKGSVHVLLGEGSGKNLEMFLLRKGNFIMINEFKYGKT